MDYAMVKALTRAKQFDGHWVREISAQVWIILDIVEHNVLLNLLHNQAEYSHADWLETVKNWLSNHTAVRLMMLDQYNKSGFIGQRDLLQMVNTLYINLKHDLEKGIDCYTICREFEKFM